jgi:hypothetical protein
MLSRVLALALSISVGGAPLAVPRSAAAASASKQCIDKVCSVPKRQCKAGFEAKFKIAKLDCEVVCSDKRCRKECKKTAKQTFKADKGECKAAFSECKPCCKSGAAPETCSAPVCGDGVQAAPEECDQGASNSDTAPNTCRTDCTLFRCGDDVVDYREECDGDDAACAGGTCRPDCVCAADLCGNGTVDPDEECDGNDDTACPEFCGPACACLDRLAFTTGAPGGGCGRINDAVDCDGTDLTPFAASGPALDCGTLYIGGGGSVQPPSPTPDGATSIFLLEDTGDAAAVVVSASTEEETGSLETCTSPGCFFGPPLPIPNEGAAAVSTCVINRIAAAPPVGGSLDVTTGDVELTLPLTVTVFVTGDLDTVTPGIQPCAQCVDGRCAVGANAGGACSTPTALLTSHDCPPPPEKTPLAPFGVDLSPLLTASVTATEAGGDFCGATMGQRNVGAFGQPTAACVTVAGEPAGNLRDGGLHDAIQASVFCIPNSGDALVDAVADLPGPGAVTLTGPLQLAP